MGRTAEYSVKGYVYQFLRYLNEILDAGAGTTVTIEGAIEDIDVNAIGSTTAVQCKYHEQAEKYTLGKIYKPVLLMVEHFSQMSAGSPDVRYRLFCHFPGSTGTQTLTRTDLDTIVATKAVGLLPIVNRVKPGTDLDDFLTRFEIEFGPSVEEYQVAVLAKLATKGFSAADIDAIIYPAAFQRIVDAATQSSVVTRTIDPAPFIASLKDVRRVTFTRWTRELATRAQIFKRLRGELKDALDRNSRSRYFVIDPDTVEDFDKDIVRFIKAFVEKYSFKYLHDNPPLFALTGPYDVGSLQVRLHDAGVKCATGLIGNAEVRLAELLRKPMIQRKPKVMLEFRLRLAGRNGLGNLGADRPDELFLVNVKEDDWGHSDINVHRFEIDRLSDLEYALQLRREYD
ncbi:hypothetical protein [Rhizobium beringeri]|uniref:hypothetical protein n=1 Tax=Rhizobium beringeri TaxID=3019934 RepID=UPI003B5CAB25